MITRLRWCKVDPLGCPVTTNLWRPRRDRKVLGPKRRYPPCRRHKLQSIHKKVGKIPVATTVLAMLFLFPPVVSLSAIEPLAYSPVTSSAQPKTAHVDSHGKLQTGQVAKNSNLPSNTDAPQESQSTLYPKIIVGIVIFFIVATTASIFAVAGKVYWMLIKTVRDSISTGAWQTRSKGNGPKEENSPLRKAHNCPNCGARMYLGPKQFLLGKVKCSYCNTKFTFKAK